MNKSILKNHFLLFSVIITVVLSSCNTIQNSQNIRHQFTNPILSGFYPDPSICKVGSDFYLVNSSFSYFPGIPVFHSKNLVSWKLIGHVMNRSEQMNLKGLGVSRGIFAPAISYNEGTFYVVCTLVDAGGNFVVTSKLPEGPWSNPVWIPQINGIDPSLFFDDNGKSYIVFNSIPPDDKSLYDGHRTIRMYEFDKVNLKVIGEERILVNGGTDISKEPVWIEAPHQYKINGMYYLMCAEGGTGEEHSEVIFRSDNVEGPYIPYEKNPILTQRHLDPKRKNAITCTGHADMVQLDSGDWWAVYLGCRPYPPCDHNYYNTGRETFLSPVKWKGGWPVINPDSELVQYKYDYPIKSEKKISQTPYGGNFTVKDEFDSNKLGLDWVFLRSAPEGWYNLESNPGHLTIQLKPETCSGTGNPSFIGRRQQHLRGSATTAIEFAAKGENEKAGLLIFQSENNYYYLCKSSAGEEHVVQLFKSVKSDIINEQLNLIAEKPLTNGESLDPIYLKIEANRGFYTFFYSLDTIDWISLKDNIDGTFLSTNTAGGFVGSMFALYATSSGQDSDNTARFDWFKYEGNDETAN